MPTNGQVSSKDQPSGATRLRQMLSDPSKTVVAPGVYDGLTARLALEAGYDCLYMVSTATPIASASGTDNALDRRGHCDVKTRNG